MQEVGCSIEGWGAGEGVGKGRMSMKESAERRARESEMREEGGDVHRMDGVVVCEEGVVSK